MAKGKYREWLTADGLLRIEGWARDGLTDEQIAKNMGINIATLYRWKKEHCEICEALKRSKDVVDRMVENALLKSALGYSYTETTRVYKASKETGELVLVSEKAVTKDVAPNTTAQIFWMKNRKPAEWRDKQSLEVSVPVNDTAAKIKAILDDE